MSDKDFEPAVATLAGVLEARREYLAVAESCTGGWLAKVCTDRAGSSAWFERGFVTYSNAAKSDMLGVDPALIERHGAVSAEVAAAMAAGALDRSPADWAVSISGVAGPEGGTPDKPVGTVWFAWAARGGEPETRLFSFPGDREAVRALSVAAAIEGLLAAIARREPPVSV